MDHTLRNYYERADYIQERLARVTKQTTPDGAKADLLVWLNTYGAIVDTAMLADRLRVTVPELRPALAEWRASHIRMREALEPALTDDLFDDVRDDWLTELKRKDDTFPLAKDN